MNVPNMGSPDAHGTHGYYEDEGRGGGQGMAGNVGGNPAVMIAGPGGYYMAPVYPAGMPALPQQNTPQFSDAMFNSFLAQFGGQRQGGMSGGQVAPVGQVAPQVGQVAPQVGQQQVLPAQGQGQGSQRYFHAAMAAGGGPTMLEFQPQFAYAMAPQASQPAASYLPAGGAWAARRGARPHGGAAVAAAPKKMSTTQSRIEKRKRLKKQGPKRPSSAYFLFSMSIREELLRQYPDAKVPELSKLSSARWKELSEDDKKPFYEQFKDNWEKYRVARKEYEATLPPKRPSGPFIQFTSEMRPKLLKDNPDKSLIEITKLVGEQWRSLPPEEKQKYTDAYKQKLKEWEEFYPDEDLDEAAHAAGGLSATSSTIPVNSER
ncbi:AaceriAGL073CAp [[Ashbya] aceris (nom. inval.)]|nr:AaceriAGL073CAp [[Ashbya] aceris (nom. inval.)]